MHIGFGEIIVLLLIGFLVFGDTSKISSKIIKGILKIKKAFTQKD